ncbi:hypothetical protein PGRAN_15357 [Listeria grandensis FSL F6-0971]|uniref:Pesticidal crystal protein Cry1Aa domain-containing protein n=1 Tax=Listeria grandensis FSL F6-0971 TaxID=1265819 RepID=W7AZS1_9LIST|nr:toxin Cry1Ac domain D-VI-related protein [Listeria grandensis]EUJ18725.1 hypothetical protein PGRAN_15357 [Listeria grandensis FSL F6-0971]
MNKKQMKKLASVLTVASILGTSIATPLNVISTEAFASEAGGSRATSYSAPNLVKITGEQTTSGNIFKYKEIDFGRYLYESKNITRGTDELEGWGLVDGVKSSLVSVSKSSISMRLNKAISGSIYASIPISTTVGKKYYVSYDLDYNQSASLEEGEDRVRVMAHMQTIKGGDTSENLFTATYGDKTESRSNGFTFTSTLSDVDIITEFGRTKVFGDSNPNGYRQTVLKNLQVREDFSDQAQDMLNALFTTPNVTTLKSGVTQADIDEVQAIIDAVVVPENKTALQNKLNPAKEQVAVRTEDQAKQAVDALFNNNMPTSNAIKSTTTQKAIDDAQKLVDAITNATVKAARQADLNKAQSLLDVKKAAAAAAEEARQATAKQAVDALFTSNSPTSNAIKPTTTQKAIDDAQKLVDAITDIGVKAVRQSDLNKAQNLLDAKNEAEATEQAKQAAAKQAVDTLFNNDTSTSNAIKPTTTQKEINDAQRLVDAMTDAAVKAARQADLDKAQSLLDARTDQVAADQEQKAVANYAVNQLFVSNTPTTDTIKTSTDQEAIDSAQAEINKISDPSLKTGLQTNLDRAQELLNERNALTKQAEQAVDELFNNGDKNGSLKAEIRSRGD